MWSFVSLVRAEGSEEGIRASIYKALELIDFKLNRPVRSVAIKPNLCYYWDASTGCTTDPRVVSGIIEWIREKTSVNTDIKVVESDATAMRTNLAFLMLGYEKLAEEKKVKLFNLSTDSTVDRKISVNGHEIKFKVPRTLLETDFFINVPKLKTMREVRMTCAMKNLFGCIASRTKIAYHPILNEAIVGINRILRPHLTVVDGVVALGRFPVKLGLIMAGSDSFSVDWTASRAMGYDPSKIAFLRMSLREKMGKPEEIAIRGEDVEAFAEMFPRENPATSRRSWKIQLGLLKLYCRIVGDIIPPVLEEN